MSALLAGGWVPNENRPHVMAERERARRAERFAQENVAYLAERASSGLDRPSAPAPAASSPLASSPAASSAPASSARKVPAKRSTVPRIAPVGPVSSVTGLPIWWTAAQVAAFHAIRSKGTR